MKRAAVNWRIALLAMPEEDDEEFRTEKRLEVLMRARTEENARRKAVHWVAAKGCYVTRFLEVDREEVS